MKLSEKFRQVIKTDKHLCRTIAAVTLRYTQNTCYDIYKPGDLVICIYDDNIQLTPSLKYRIRNGH